MRLDDVPDPQGVDVYAWESPCETARAPFAAQFTRGVGIFWVVVVVFFEREGVIVGVALGEADAVCGLGARDDDFFDAEFAGCFDDVVGA